MSKERAKGTSFETAVLPGLRLFWPDAERTGSRDYAHGDFDTFRDRRVPAVVEAKNEASYAGKLSTWFTQARESADRLAMGPIPAFVVHKRRGTARPDEQWVLTTVGNLILALNMALQVDAECCCGC